MSSRAGRIAGWWRDRTLHTRLALLVAGAVAAAVLGLAALAWTSVNEVVQHQTESELQADAEAIAAAPDAWTAAAPALSGRIDQGSGRGSDGHRPHDLGPRWQILDAQGRAVSESASSLPVTSGASAVASGSRTRVQETITVAGDQYSMLTVPVTRGGAVQVAINQDVAGHTLDEFGLLLAVGCLLGIAAAAVLGRAVARAGLRPVQSLTEAVEEVAVTNDLTQPIDVVGDDEIGRLARSVNSMLAAIESARQAQRTLVEDASHELRTPLTSIRTNIELLLAVERQPELSHRLPPEERAGLLHDLEAQVTELGTLTTELVELAREEGTREAIEPVELADVVEAAVSRVRTRAPNITFETRIEPITIDGRAGELERMVVNVLDNAAKFSPAGATVQTQLAADGPDWCLLSVQDQGSGIDDADRPHVFDRFYRAPAARGLPGSGLGLAIVSQAAIRHGGTVSAGPNQPQGTVVAVRLPRAPVVAERAGAVRS